MFLSIILTILTVSTLRNWSRALIYKLFLWQILVRLDFPSVLFFQNQIMSSIVLDNTDTICFRLDLSLLMYLLKLMSSDTKMQNFSSSYWWIEIVKDHLISILKKNIKQALEGHRKKTLEDVQSLDDFLKVRSWLTQKGNFCHVIAIY